MPHPCGAAAWKWPNSRDRRPVKIVATRHDRYDQEGPLYWQRREEPDVHVHPGELVVPPLGILQRDDRCDGQALPEGVGSDRTKKGLFIGSDGKNLMFTFILVSSLFLLWGFCNGMIDVMDKHFQKVLGQIGPRRASLLAATGRT